MGSRAQLHKRSEKSRSSSPGRAILVEPLEERLFLSAAALPYASPHKTAPASSSRSVFPQNPYRKNPVSIPGTIQAEDYDRGGWGVAYYDTTRKNQGGKYRPKEFVDLAHSGDTDGSYAILWARRNEWIEYTFNATMTGYYDVGMRVASAGPGGKFYLQVDDKRVTPKLQVPDTGGARINWTTLTVPSVYLTRGRHELRLVMDANGPKGVVGSFNWFSFTPVGMMAPSDLVVVDKSTGHLQLAWRDNSNNETGFKIDRMINGSGVWELIGTVGADVTSLTDTGLEPGTVYAYRVCATDGLRDSDYSAAAIETTTALQIAPDVVEPVFTGPIVITKGGTYTGNWESTDPSVPAVRIATSEPVIIENALIRSRGNLIESLGARANITVRNTTGVALNPMQAWRHPGRFLDAEQFVNIVLENNTMEGTSGIYLYDYRGNGSDGQTIKVLRNKAINIDGRYSNGADGYQTGPGAFYNVSFVQLNAIYNLRNIEIAWNQVINEAGKSRVEDNISIYRSSGTPDNPIRIHNNFIQGAYPADPADPDYAGGGIMLSDVGSAYVHAYENQVVGTTNYGICISSGHSNAFYNNRVLSSGRLPDGTPIPAQNVGAYIWNFDGDPAFSNNSGWGNLVGWVNGNARNDWWVPNAAMWSGNTNWPGAVTLATEAAEYALWLQKLSNNGVQVGSSGTVPSTPANPPPPTPTPTPPINPVLPPTKPRLPIMMNPGSGFSSQRIVATDGWLRSFDQTLSGANNDLLGTNRQVLWA